MIEKNFMLCFFKKLFFKVSVSLTQPFTTKSQEYEPEPEPILFLDSEPEPTKTARLHNAAFFSK